MCSLSTLCDIDTQPIFNGLDKDAGWAKLHLLGLFTRISSRALFFVLYLSKPLFGKIPGIFIEVKPFA
jgi:hypothetical protein